MAAFLNFIQTKMSFSGAVSILAFVSVFVASFFNDTIRDHFFSVLLLTFMFIGATYFLLRMLNAPESVVKHTVIFGINTDIPGVDHTWWSSQRFFDYTIKKLFNKNVARIFFSIYTFYMFNYIFNDNQNIWLSIFYIISFSAIIYVFYYFLFILRAVQGQIINVDFIFHKLISKPDPRSNFHQALHLLLSTLDIVALFFAYYLYHVWSEAFLKVGSFIVDLVKSSQLLQLFQ